MGRHKNVGRPRKHAKNWKHHYNVGRPRRVGRPAGIHTPHKRKTNRR